MTVKITAGSQPTKWLSVMQANSKKDAPSLHQTNLQLHCTHLAVLKMCS